MPSITHVKQSIRSLKTALPWTSTPLVVGAPMRVISGPALAVAVSEAGGLGFIGPGEKPSDLEPALVEAKKLISQSSVFSVSPNPGLASRGLLPIGVGFQTWAGDLTAASRILRSHPPAVAWLFAPRYGQQELDDWTRGLRMSSPETQIWIQVASVADAMEAARSSSPPDVLVVQGTDAGGHSRTQGAGVVTLLPEVADALSAESRADMPLIAAGGIADSRGIAAALALGATGVAIGTRLLASFEARINPGYQKHVIAAKDGGQTTVRTQLYNHLRGTTNWPAPFDARGLINQSWLDHKAGVPFERNREMYAEAMKRGELGWGEDGRMATYAGTDVGLVKEVKHAGEIISEVRGGVTGLLQAALENSQSDGTPVSV